MDEEKYWSDYLDSIDWSNKEQVLEEVRRYGDVLYFASEILRADKEVVLAAVKNCGYDLAYASDELTNDREVVLAAVMQDGMALEYASESLRADKSIVLEAIKKDVRALEYANGNLMRDRDFMLEAVKIDGIALNFASEELKSDVEIALAAVKNIGDAVFYVRGDARKDKNVWIEAYTSYLASGMTTQNPLNLIECHNPFFEIDSRENYRLQEKRVKEEIITEANKRLKERQAQHSASEIVEGIEPKQSDIDAAYAQITSEQERQEDRKTEQEQK